MDQGRTKGQYTMPSTVRVRLIFTLPNTKQAHITVHGSVAAGPIDTPTIAQAIDTALKGAAAWTNWKAKLNTGVAFTGTAVLDQRFLNQAEGTYTAASQAGTGAGTALPPGDALTVTLRTANAGRGFRGRVYLPGLDSTAMDVGGVASADTMAKASAFVTGLQTAMAASGITLGIAQPPRVAYTSTKTGTFHAARDATAPIPVTTILTRNNIMDHQRRRSGRS
jgi:hypothetical protein